MGTQKNGGAVFRAVALPRTRSEHPLHRIGEARRAQGISTRAAARRLGCDVAQARQEQEPDQDMPLSRLYDRQEVLQIPIAELLTPPRDELSPPVHFRSHLVRIMKTVLSLKEAEEPESAERLLETLIAQLVELMPELAEIGSWHSVGQRRRRDDLGVAALRRLTTEMFVEMMD